MRAYKELEKEFKEIRERYYAAVYEGTENEDYCYEIMNNLAEDMWDYYPVESETFFYGR